MKYYLVGIKGSGMAALACMLSDLGHMVVGSDVAENFGFEDGLFKRNIEIVEFNALNITSEYVYIIGNAYNKEHVEVAKIINKNYTYYYYQDFIKTLSGIHIVVSGTHGKTTTTKMIVELLKGEKIAYIIGDGTGGAVKNYKYLIYEACEYQDHFLAYKPDILVINKVELDHPDYFSSLEQVYSSFNKLAKKSSCVITKIDNGFKKKCNFIFYGSGLGDYNIKILKQNSLGYEIRIEEDNLDLCIPLYGKHMIDNFISAYIVIRKLGYTKEYIKNKVKGIKMPKRRMEEENICNQIIVKDYAHHPTEIKALYDSLIQKYPNYKMCVFFQPHTYSRTLALSSSFVSSLKCFDEVYVFPTFSSRRENVDIVLQKEVDVIFKDFKKVFSIEEIKYDNIPKVYIFLGAGDIHKYSNKLIENIMKINNENY